MNISSMNGMTQGSSKILQCQKYKRESLKCLNMKTGSEPVCKIKQKFHSSFFNSTFSVYKCINIRNTLYPCLFMDPFSRIIIAFSRGRAILKQNKYFGTSFRSLIRRGVKKTRIFYSQADCKGGAASSALTVSNCENFDQFDSLILKTHSISL